MTTRHRFYSREQLLARAGARLVRAQRRCIKWFGTGGARHRSACIENDAAMKEWNNAVGLPASTSNADARLREIVSIIEAVEYRCMSVDGTATRATKAMTSAELTQIYRLARGS